MAYEGMRWLKCDLHMHTPIDTANWLDTTSSQDPTELAKLFVQACLDSELDVVAITDHNFESKDFIPILQEELRLRVSRGERKITLFPGFEFEANVGRGAHVVALFEPSISMEEIDTALTECGVGYPRVQNGTFKKSTESLSKILSVIQSKHKGIVILPHCMSNEGIFDNNNISEWLQQDQYLNHELLAVEVPKAVSQMNDGFQKLFRAGNDCLPEWKRIRPVATIMSSDCKNLVKYDANSNHEPNSIGSRYSWIKMSAPSIESLRQAFLDHDSRIVLPANVNNDYSPEKRNSIAKIKSIKIENVAFLENQEIVFSPNINALIGGRGCGKSTVLEYLRMLFQQERDLDQHTRNKVARIKGTIISGSTLSVCWKNSDRVSDTIVYINGNSVVQDRDLADPKTFFDNLPVTFFSQQQITHLTDSKAENGRNIHQTKQLLDLIDGFVRADLQEYGTREIEAVRSVEDSFTMQKKIREAQKDQKKYEQEFVELERQWKAHREIENDAKKHNALSAEKRLLKIIQESINHIESTYTTAQEEVAKLLFESNIEETPHKTQIDTFKSKISQNRNELNTAVQTALIKFIHDLDTLKDESWRIMEKELADADENFRKACEALGLSTEAVGHLQEINVSMEKKKHEIDDCKKRISDWQAKAESPDIALDRVYEIWRKQYDKRLNAAEEGNRLAVLEGQNFPFISIAVEYGGDFSDFMTHWKIFSPKDRRTKLGRAWEDVGENLYNAFIADKHSHSPWDLIRKDGGNRFANISQTMQCDSNEFYEHVLNNLDQWQKLLVSRVQDSVDLTLYREDGSEAGRIANGTLSDGQRNTAALVLLLAQNGGPLIIDQPEDELDSNFVYRELIPMLRKVKNKRQIIIATHNANLPVNGDAELVYALEAKNGHGKMLAQGGLDRPNVTQAILDIMEGSQEAFQKRREKYHF